MSNFEKYLYKTVFYAVFAAAILFVLFLLADIYQNKDSRENMVFLCTFIACAAAVMSIVLSIENNIERKKLIRTIEKATEEIQGLKNEIAKFGKSNASQW